MDPRSQFGREAEKYLSSKTHGDLDEMARLVELAKPSGGIVVDVATGAGHVAFAFEPFVGRMIASDITPEMLMIVDREAKRRALPNLETALVRAEELPYGDRTLRGITCRLGAHHFSDALSFVRECFRALEPQGWLLLVDTVGVEEDEAADDRLNLFETLRDPSHVRDYTVSQWKHWLAGVGFEIQQTELKSVRHDLNEWMDRMSVTEPVRSTLEYMLEDSDGAFRRYLEPVHGSFLLHQMTLLARKPG